MSIPGTPPDRLLTPLMDPTVRSLLDALPVGAYICNAEGLITYYNGKAVEAWGRAPSLNDPGDRWCGSYRLFDASTGEPLPHDACWMALAIKQGRAYHGKQIVIERPDGTRWTALAHANPIRGPLGEVTGAVNVLVDVTNLKHADEASARAALYSELQEADRAKNRFLAILSHELRNPLAPLRTTVETLQQVGGTSSPEIAASLHMMHRQITQMARLIDDLLDISRVTTSKLDLRKEPVELSEVLRAAVEASRPILAASDHELEVKLAPGDSIWLDADFTRLTQVVANLLNNAAKYTPESGKIVLAAEREGNEAVIRVTDNGIGIPADMLPRIFDMFMQVEAPMGHGKGGLGIGLTLAQRLVDMHGGSITARSDGPGHGSEFAIRLPARMGAPRSSEAPPHDLTEKTKHPLQILVVDDNRDAADSLAMLLALQGHVVQVAYDSRDAIEQASVFLPDVMLLDIGLPGLNGYETAQQVRQQPWGRNLLLIAVTGWGQEEARRRSWEAGFDSHLVKPVDPAMLVDLLGALAEGRKSVSR